MCKGKRLMRLACSRKHTKVIELQEGNMDGKWDDTRWQAWATSCRAEELGFQPLKNFAQNAEGPDFSFGKLMAPLAI